MSYRRKKPIRALSLLLAIMMTIELIAGVFRPVLAEAAEAEPKSTYADEGKLYFRLPQTLI